MPQHVPSPPPFSNSLERGTPIAPPLPGRRSNTLRRFPHIRAESFFSPTVTWATDPPAAPSCWSTASPTA